MRNIPFTLADVGHEVTFHGTRMTLECLVPLCRDNSERISRDNPAIKIRAMLKTADGSHITEDFLIEPTDRPLADGR